MSISPSRTHDPFPPRPHRTGRADFPHPALGQVSRARMRREEASDFDDAEATIHLVVTEAARRARQLMPPPHVLAFTYSLSRNSSSFVRAVRLITNRPLVHSLPST